MVQLVQRQLILAKIEATWGVDSAPTAAANSVLVSALTFNETVKFSPRKVIKPSLAPLQEVFGPYLAEVSFDVEIRGSGAAGTIPEYDALLQSCALSSTVVASTSVTYLPISSGQVSCTIYVYNDGSLFKMTGCQGTYDLEIKSGTIGLIKFKIMGHLESHTDVALPAATFSTVVPPIATNAVVTIGAYAPIMISHAFKSGIKVDMPESIGSVDGYGPLIITERDSKGSVELEAVTISTYDFYGDMSGGTAVAFSLAYGGTAGNKVAITHPKLYVSDVKTANQGGVLMFTVEYGAVESGPDTDDEIKIVFT